MRDPSERTCAITVRKPHRWAETQQKSVREQSALISTLILTKEGVNRAVKDINYMFEKTAKHSKMKTKIVRKQNLSKN